MAEKKWYVSKVRYCEHVGHEIALETQVVLPSEYLPEQKPRVTAHRCSNAMQCDQQTSLCVVWHKSGLPSLLKLGGPKVCLVYKLSPPSELVFWLPRLRRRGTPLNGGCSLAY